MWFLSFSSWNYRKKNKKWKQFLKIQRFCHIIIIEKNLSCDLVEDNFKNVGCIRAIMGKNKNITI